MTRKFERELEQSEEQIEKARPGYSYLFLRKLFREMGISVVRPEAVIALKRELEVYAKDLLSIAIQLANYAGRSTVGAKEIRMSAWIWSKKKSI